MKKETIKHDLYERMGNVNFENAVKTSELPSHVQAVLQARKQVTVEHIDHQALSVIEPDVWKLIKQKANNPQEMARMNGVLRLLLA